MIHCLRVLFMCHLRTSATLCVALLFGANEVRCVVNATGAFVFGDLGIRTQRACAIDLTTGRMRGNHAIRRLSLLNPFFQGLDHIEHVWPLAAAAMTHARGHEQANRFISLLGAATVRDYASEIVDAIQWSDLVVRPAVIKDQFASV